MAPAKPPDVRMVIISTMAHALSINVKTVPKDVRVIRHNAVLMVPGQTSFVCPQPMAVPLASMVSAV